MTSTRTVVPGDTIEITGHRLGEHARFAEVLEVIGESADARYRVHWDDGRETIVYPASDVVVHHKRRRRS
jgi:hypothetical protein